MPDPIARRTFLTAAVASLGCAAQGAELTRSLRPFLRPDGFFKRSIPSADEIIDRAELSGRVGFSVAGLTDGQRLETHNANVATPPASVTKAVTALYALDVLGPTHKFATRVLATGPVVDGRLDGDLVLVGGCDPTLDTIALAGLAKAVKAGGLREVTGKFLVADGILPRIHTIDPDQPDQVSYSPAVSGISLNFNRVHFQWQRSGSAYAVAMDARTEGYRPEVAMAVMRVVERRLPIYTYNDSNGRDAWTVARPALGNGGARWLPVRKPGAYAGDVFRTLIRAHGIQLPKAAVVSDIPEGTEVARHESAPLVSILQGMLRYSTNLTAEMVGLAATVTRGHRPTDLRGSAQHMNAWAAESFGTDGLQLVDHSGLGSDSRMTADAMVDVLTRLQTVGALRPILKEFVMRDGRGRPNRDHPIEVEAKTGTLNFVSTLAGYMTAPDGTELAFAILTADEARRARIGRANRESPDGARGWNRRAKGLQQALIERWGAVYGT